MTQRVEILNRAPCSYAVGDGATRRMSAVVVFVSTVIAGAVSWFVVRPGDSMLIPIVLDVAIFVIVGVAQHQARPWHRYHLGRGANSWLIVSLCVASVLWTYFGVLSASVYFDSGAASRARHEVAISASGCHVVEHGSIGFIDAPYQVCTTVLGSASIVDFTKAPYTHGGYSYITGQSVGSWFPDGCARHLIGHWWAYATTGATGCPFGYAMQAGP